jgi:ribosomal protein S27AE
MDDLEKRIFRAYFRKFGKNADIPQQEIEYKKFNGKDCAILSNCNGVLAVYRLLDDDKVKLEKNMCPYCKSIKHYHTKKWYMSAEARELRSEAYKKLEEYRAKKQEFEMEVKR